MKIIKYLYNPRFKKSVKNFSQKDKEKIIEKINLFLVDPYSPGLETHKLSGKLKDFWSFSISYQLRILFRFSKDNIVEFIDIGGHGIYK